MTRIGISITKTTLFRDSTQDFSNVYYYDGLLGAPSESDANTLIDQVADREKLKHGTHVTFKRGRLWVQTGDKATTVMISQKNLSGTGAGTPESGMDRERAFLFRLRAGVDSRGNPVYLRKWFHWGSYPSGVAGSTGINQNTTGFTQAQRDALVGHINSIGSIGSGATLGTLVSKNGRTTSAGFNWESHKYLEHRQMGDMWRAS